MLAVSRGSGSVSAAGVDRVDRSIDAAPLRRMQLADDADHRQLRVGQAAALDQRTQLRFRLRRIHVGGIDHQRGPGQLTQRRRVTAQVAVISEQKRRGSDHSEALMAVERIRQGLEGLGLIDGLGKAGTQTGVVGVAGTRSQQQGAAALIVGPSQGSAQRSQRRARRPRRSSSLTVASSPKYDLRPVRPFWAWFSNPAPDKRHVWRD